MFTHCVINSTPSALRARPPRRGTVQVGFTERLHSASSSALSPGQGEYPKGEGVKVNCYIVPLTFNDYRLPFDENSSEL